MDSHETSLNLNNSSMLSSTKNDPDESNRSILNESESSETEGLSHSSTAHEHYFSSIETSRSVLSVSRLETQVELDIRVGSGEFQDNSADSSVSRASQLLSASENTLREENFGPAEELPSHPLQPDADCAEAFSGQEEVVVLVKQELQHNAQGNKGGQHISFPEEQEVEYQSEEPNHKVEIPVAGDVSELNSSFSPLAEEGSSPNKRPFASMVNQKCDAVEVRDGEVEDNPVGRVETGASQDGLPSKKARVSDPDLPDTVQVLVSQNSGAKIYLVGTAHFSLESCEDVSRIIQAVQPDIVMVELCKQRTSILHMDEETILQEAQNLSMERSLEILRQQGALQGVMYLLLLSMSAHITKELGMAPGGEFRRAYQEAQKVPRCMVHLGDRPIGITLQRALAGLSVWQKIRLGFNILTSKDTITKEEVEKCKQRDLLENMLAEMAGEFPALSRVFVSERDLFLAHSLQMSADSIPAVSAQSGAPVPRVVVGVVGIGHVPGIVQNWGKVTKDQIREIVRVDPPSVVERIIKIAVKTVLIGSCCYGAYRLARIPVSRFLLAR